MSCNTEIDMARTHVLPQRQLRELEAELLSERKRLERLLDVDAYMDESLSNGDHGHAPLTDTGVGGGVQTRTRATTRSSTRSIDWPTAPTERVWDATGPFPTAGSS